MVVFLKVFALETMPDQLVQIFSNILKILPEVMTNNLQSVREHVASLIVLICGYLSCQNKGGLSSEKLQLIADAQVKVVPVMWNLTTTIFVPSLQLPSAEYWLFAPLIQYLRMIVLVQLYI